MVVAIDWMQTFFAVKVIGGIVMALFVLAFVIYAITNGERSGK